MSGKGNKGKKISENNFVKEPNKNANSSLIELNSSSNEIPEVINYNVKSTCVCDMCNLYNSFLLFKNKYLHNLAIELMKDVDSITMDHSIVNLLSRLNANHILFKSYISKIEDSLREKVKKDLEDKLSQIMSKI